MTETSPEHKNVPTMVEWVDIVAFDAINQSTVREARCILSNGVIECEGNPRIVAELQNGIQFSPTGPCLTLADGRAFLEALAQRYNSVYLFATEVKKGDEPVDHVVPPVGEL